MRLRYKLAVIAVLALILAVPLLLVVSKIYERDSYHDQVRAEISRSWTGQQQVMGPILVVPYTRVFEKREYDQDLRKHVSNSYEAFEYLFIMPDTLNGDAKLKTEIRSRGIYDVPVYSSTVSLNGSFSTTRLVELSKRHDVVAIKNPYLSILVNDMRGLAEPPTLKWASSEVEFLPGSKLAFHSNGIHAPLGDPNRDVAKPHSFSVSLSLRGMSSFRFSPVGDSSLVTIASAWPHPRFDGQYLPTEREISDDGFTATWQMSAFATNISKKADDCAKGNCAELVASYLGVELVDPVDVYLQAQRASKYGILFIGMTFTAFFLFEVLKKFAIHPIQYTLVGLALTVFYLLLVSLAEHIAFAWAYSIATAACVGLLAFYISHVLKSIKLGISFGLGIAVLYGILYTIIQLEDYAFSTGSIIVFVVLSGIMYVTRKVDWFEISQSTLEKIEDAKDPKNSTGS